MTPGEMALLIAENHPGELGWSEDGIAAMLAHASVVTVTDPDGFILLRIATTEADILTVEVRPRAQGRGLGTRLLAEAIARAEAAGVTDFHLEVARDNAPAFRLYSKAGFKTVGTRAGYYRSADRTPVDALRMRRGTRPAEVRIALRSRSART